MHKHGIFIGIIALAVGAGGGYYFGSRGMGEAPMHPVKGGMGVKEHGLRRAMDKLWSDHVFWTRQVIVSAIAQLGDLDVALKRLLRNQNDIGDAVVPFYGKEAGDKLAALLHDHITLAVDVVKAAIAKDDAGVKAADAKWHANADDLAEFLSKANPNNWPKDAMQKMFYEHLKLTTQEAVLRLASKWEDDVANFDKIYEQILMMAHDLSDGIVKQFPDKF